MKHLQDLATPINVFANSLRLIGLILLVVGGVALISYSSGKPKVWDVFTGVMLHMAVAGAIIASIGEALWKTLLRNSDVTKRKFYFYDEK